MHTGSKTIIDVKIYLKIFWSSSDGCYNFGFYTVWFLIVILNTWKLIIIMIYKIEPHREKTGFLPRRKQRRRSASR